ncbi:DUF2065 domain-containing protein [Roseateles sp.]|uniref:DUF2065 domain-containing protein n=1 Tax=Roseateles sp. TaxID=1971397 RepID=UPI003BAA69CF
MNELLLALALMMVVEGVMPLVSPRRWRDVFSRLLAMSDGQIRFIGLASMVMGLLAVLFLLR